LHHEHFEFLQRVKKPMRKYSFLLFFAAVVSTACSDKVIPDAQDGAIDRVIPDAGNDAIVPFDRTTSDATQSYCGDGSSGLVPVLEAGMRNADVAQPGSAWCDLPQTASSMVRGVTLPAGFCIRRYARLAHSRVMAFAPNGDLYVASPGMVAPGSTGPGTNTISILPDDNRDGVADQTQVFARITPSVPGLSEMTTVHGLLFHNQSLYFTTQNGVWRVPHCNVRSLAAGVVPERIATLDSERWTHTLSAGADGTVYVSMGVYGSSMCPMANAHRGAVLAVGPGHSMGGDIVARGFRNPMYIRCQTWGCYAAELTDDGWVEGGREKIIRFENGQNYGYPCCYDRNRPSPVNGGASCSDVVASMVGFPVGYTPFGHDFERGNWPTPYANGLFVGLHGVVGSWEHTGIRWAPVNPDTHAFVSSEAQVFMSGWGRGTPNEGRVADLTFAPDGRLFFTDDQLGEVYWIAPNTLRMP
jgi:glucose/arabinose dehydrogenase